MVGQRRAAGTGGDAAAPATPPSLAREAAGRRRAAGGGGRRRRHHRRGRQRPDRLARCRLGVIPLGTANVLAHELALPFAPRAVAAALAFGRTRPLWPGIAHRRGAAAGCSCRCWAPASTRRWCTHLPLPLKRAFGRGAYVRAGAARTGALPLRADPRAARRRRRPRPAASSSARAASTAAPTCSRPAPRRPSPASPWRCSIGPGRSRRCCTAPPCRSNLMPAHARVCGCCGLGSRPSRRDAGAGAGRWRRGGPARR